MFVAYSGQLLVKDLITQSDFSNSLLMTINTTHK